MASSARNVLPSSCFGSRWLASLVLLLAVFGGLLIDAGMRERSPQTIAARQVWVSAWAGAAMTSLLRPPMLARDDGPRHEMGGRRGLRRAVPEVRGWSGAVPGCLWTDCAPVLNRTWPRMATNCPQGDLRVAFMAMATAQHRGRWTAARPCPMLQFACHRPGPVSSEDRIANALFGPGQPDESDAVDTIAARCSQLSRAREGDAREQPSHRRVWSMAAVEEVVSRTTSHLLLESATRACCTT